MEGVTGSRQPAQQCYRSKSTVWVAAVFVFMGLLIIVEGVATIVNPHKGDSAARLAGIVAVVAGALWTVWAVLIVARMGVTINDKGVVIHSWLRRRYIGWYEIAGFSFGVDLQTPSLRVQFSTPMLSTYISLCDGRHLAMAGPSATRVNRSKCRAKVQELLDELEAQRRYFTGT